MKDKPVSHKSQNTFHFLTFSERISKINIDVIHQIGKISSSPEDANTFFLEAVEKWEDLNYSLDYVDLRTEIGLEIRNLSQIVFRQEEIIKVLLKYLEKEESLALDAVLELIVALARDLQYEFYPHFPKFFSAIVLHLSTKDTDLLEKLFTCLAYLFKFLWKYMTKDIENVYRLFSSLLSKENKEHIRVFAVESFAFLIRKVQDRKKLFAFIFEELKKNPEQSTGVGLLFFEVIKGVKEQFHSCTEKVLKLLFGFLGDENFSTELIEETLSHMVQCILKHTNQKYCLVIQEVFCDVIEELLAEIEGESSIVAIKQLNSVLRLFTELISHKNGKFISSNSKIVQVFLNLCDKDCLPEFCMDTISSLVSFALKNDCLSLPWDKINAMVTKIFSRSEETFIYFTREAFGYGMFEKDILPHLLSACSELVQNNVDLKKKALAILAETIVSLKSRVACSDDVDAFTKLYFCLPENSNVLEDVLYQMLSVECISLAELPDMWNAVICLPHIRILKAEASTILYKLAINLQKYLLSECIAYSEAEKYSFFLCQVYYTYLIVCKDTKKVKVTEKDSFDASFFTELLKKHPKSVSILRIVNLYFNQIKKSTNMQMLLDILPDVISNLASPFHKIRLFTLQILDAFSHLFNKENQEPFIFAICLEAEKLTLDVQSYREKLKWFRKLEYQFLEKQFPTECEELFKKIPVYFLLGMLFVNFRLLWEPATEILETYAHGSTKIFWDVFGNYLNEASDMCEKSNFQFEELWEVEDPVNGDYTFLQQISAFCIPAENPDVGNQRMLLWKAMEKFPDVVEPKNKSVVPLVFRLIANEISKIDNSMALKESIRKGADVECSFSTVTENFENENKMKNLKRKMRQDFAKSKKQKPSLQVDEPEQEECAVEEVEDEDDEDEDVESDDEDVETDADVSDDEAESSQKETANIKDENKSCQTKSWTKRKFSVTKTLATYLSVFAKFKNPKAIYKSEDLLKLYNELLSYHDPLIQKLSFDCIVTYKFSYLTPYKENFYKILDNKTFKHEVVLFSLDKQNEVIQEEHRMDVLAILMRILYGKMLHKTGNNTTGKSQANTRRAIVLRFLAGCTATELKMFFDLVFMPFQPIMKDETLVIVKKIRESVDLTNIVPLRRQHSALNSLGLILQHLGNLVPELLPWLLKVLLVITATSTTLLERREDVLPSCINLLKSIRTLAVMKLIQFFKFFSKYKFTPEEIDAVFEAIVWPILPRLQSESVNQPSPLLRLLSTWSENARYFVLFSKHHEKSKSLNPMTHLIALYTTSRARPRVLGAISKIIFQLLSAEDNNNVEDDVVPLDINNSLCLPSKVKDETDGISYGTKLLLPFVNNILQRLEATISIITRKKSKKLLSSRDLSILLRISCFIDNPEQCSKLINLLVPFLQKPKIDSQSEILILTTISYLMKKVADPEAFMKLLAPLFGKLTNQNSRAALANVFTTMAEIKEDLDKMAVVIAKVNAFDSNLIGEPDLQQRLDGHKEALELIRSMAESDTNENFIRIIIYNSANDIRMLDDGSMMFALRNSSSLLLREIVKVIATFQDSKPELFALLVFDTLLLEVQKGLKCTSEVKRHEFIGILSTVLHNCENQPRLKELVSLCNLEYSSEQKQGVERKKMKPNPDMDFWENIRHLQVHRRAKALRDFSDTLKKQREEQKTVNLHYLLAYMIPIVQSFLFNDAYKKHVNVIDEAIEALGSIAGVLSWHHYELLLKQYLNLIMKDADHHKTIIKIVVSLLNAFPYNLKAPENADTVEKVSSPKEVQHKSDSTACESNPDAVKETSDFNALTPEMRGKINGAIRRNILPLLHRSLMRKTKHDGEHKLAGHYYPEDDEILRVPIALAMVKLLQKLPHGTLEKALPGLLLKMCELLKSRTESIRQTTRETLKKMMQSLGPKYFHFLLKEMMGVMKKGYQVHVMIFTLNEVLIHIKNQLSSGDLDDCIKDLTEICLNELFSDVAEEKEVTKITGKLKEARSVKSYSIFQVVSTYISESLLLDLISPLKEALFTKRSHKSMKKISKCFRHIALGISENRGLSEKGLLIFMHAIVSETIPGLNPKKNKASLKNSKYERPDIYLVPKEPGRSGPPAKINEKTNIHILVEFGLQTLQFCLKKEKISKRERDTLEMLDPFVSLLCQCLSSKYIKIVSTALRCLLPLYEYALPSFKDLAKKVVDALFILINKYASPGMGQGENFEMIVMSFKMMAKLVGSKKQYYKINDDELHALLSYVEQDIYDNNRQATALSLLKAILSKKIELPELQGIMSKVAEMSITSEKESVRSQCGQLCMRYMSDYPLGKRLVKSVSYFVAQLEYPYEHGRLSCLEIINNMISEFPENIVKNHAALYFVPLSARLVNDESAQCKKMSAQCIIELLKKVDHNGRAGLFPVAFNWLQAKKMSYKRLGAQLCGLFAEAEGEQFENHLLQILPSYTELIEEAANAEVKKEADERCTDHFLYHLLNSLTKISKKCFCCVIRKPQYSELFNEFWDKLQGLILYPHMWVRVATSQLFGLLFSTYSVEEINEAVLREDGEVYINSISKLRNLSYGFLRQIQTLHWNEVLGEREIMTNLCSESFAGYDEEKTKKELKQVEEFFVENLVYLARILSKLPDSSDEPGRVRGSLSWMISKMCREAKMEVAKAPTHSLRRKCVFMFIEAMVNELGKEKLLPFLDIILFPLCREDADASKNADAGLKKKAQEVLNRIQLSFSEPPFDVEYSEHLASVHSSLVKKKIKRKRDKAQEAITDPEKFAKRKIRKQESKKESKKRKILVQKGKRKTKRPKLADIVIAS